MLDGLKPVKAESLKESCVAQLEELILSGAVAVGEKLPPERDLATRLGVSRPVVHDALVDIAAKGIVSIIPRVGTVVNDYLREGSLALLTSLLSYQKENLDPKLLRGLLDMRMLFEMENARLAALHRTLEHLERFYAFIFEESEIDPGATGRIVQLDFEFHFQVAMATGNILYPLMLNSFKPVYTTLSAFFFSDPEVLAPVFANHKKLVSAISGQEEDRAAGIMRDILSHGEAWLQTILSAKEVSDERDRRTSRTVSHQATPGSV